MVKALIALVTFKDHLQKPAVLITLVCHFRGKILIWFENHYAERVSFLSVLLRRKSILTLGVCYVGCFFLCSLFRIFEGIKVTTAFNSGFFINNMGIYARKYTIKREHVIIRNAFVISLDRCKEMKIRSFWELFFNLARRKALICDNDSSSKIIIAYKCRIWLWIYTVAREYLGTYGFHQFNIVSIENGDLAASSYSRFVGVCRQVIDYACVLL